MKQIKILVWVIVCLIMCILLKTCSCTYSDLYWFIRCLWLVFSPFLMCGICNCVVLAIFINFGLDNDESSLTWWHIGTAGVGMIIILLSDQDLILGLSLPVVGRTTRSPLVSGRMVGVLMTRRIRHPAYPRVLGAMIVVLQGLVHGHTGMNFIFIDWIYKKKRLKYPKDTHNG